MKKYLDSIPTLNDFRMAVDFDRHLSIPDDWVLFATDIKTSTLAIESGHYKDVNVIGAACIMSVLNALDRVSVPYVFGGDGATLLTPPELADAAAKALLGTQNIAKIRFNLELRVGRIQVKALRLQGGEIRVARLQKSVNFFQTILSGNGLSMADKWIKDPSPSNPYLIYSKESSEADFTGLECRWEPVKSQKGEIVSVVTQALGETEQSRNTYLTLIKKIDEIYGSETEKTPLKQEALKLSFAFGNYASESKFRTKKKGVLPAFYYQFKTWLFTNVFSLLWNTALKKDGDRYKSELVSNSDFLKFDGGLKFVIDSLPEKTERLEAFMVEQYNEGRLLYGIHRSDSALLTCLIFERSQGKHVHFIDGSDGGYAQAASQMKAKASFQKLKKVV